MSNTRDDKIDDAVLGAYVDREVSDTERARIEAFLATHPETAAEVAHWQRQKAGLRPRKLLVPLLLAAGVILILRRFEQSAGG